VPQHHSCTTLHIAPRPESAPPHPNPPETSRSFQHRSVVSLPDHLPAPQHHSCTTLHIAPRPESAPPHPNPPETSRSFQHRRAKGRSVVSLPDHLPARRSITRAPRCTLRRDRTARTSRSPPETPRSLDADHLRSLMRTLIDAADLRSPTSRSIATRAGRAWLVAGRHRRGRQVCRATRLKLDRSQRSRPHSHSSSAHELQTITRSALLVRRPGANGRI
jgi:hypothetical protein